MSVARGSRRRRGRRRAGAVSAARVALAHVVALAAAACGPMGSVTHVARVPADPAGLNAPLVVVLDGPIDPLSVTARSVEVRADDGRVLPARRRVQGGELVVELEVDAALLSAPPSGLEIRLAGLPSVHSLALLDGRRLGAARTVRVSFGGADGLSALGDTSTRLVAVDGHPVPPPSPLATGTTLRLLFDGVLDPTSLDDEGCPLRPVEQGLVVGQPVAPPLRWRCVGRRFEVELDLAGWRGTWELDLRQFKGRDLSGAPPQPALKTELSLS